eukprot:g3742.t1
MSSKEKPRQLLPLNLTYQTTPRSGKRGWLDSSDKYALAKVVEANAQELSGASESAASLSSSLSSEGMSSDESDAITSAYAVAVPAQRNPETDAAALEYALSLQESLKGPTCLDKMLSFAGLLENTKFSRDHNRAILESKLSLRINKISLFDGTRSCFDILGPEILVLSCDVLYHTLLDDYPEALATLKKIASEENDGIIRNLAKDVDGRDATQYFSAEENDEPGRHPNYISGSSNNDSDDDFSPSYSSTSDDDRDYYAYKKDYRKLYYKEMKRRSREKHRRKALEHALAQQSNMRNTDDSNAQEMRDQSKSETGTEAAGSSPSFSPPKLDISSEKVQKSRAQTANPDDRLREWPHSEAIVRVRLEGPTLASHLAGRTGTRGEWIEQSGKYVVVLDGKSKGRAAIKVRVRKSDMIVISPCAKERPVNTPQPLPDVYYVKHRQDPGAIVQLVRDPKNHSNDTPTTPELCENPSPEASSRNEMSPQYQQNYSREAIDAEYERFKSNAAKIPNASEFASMPSNASPPSRGMLGTFLEANASDNGSARVSYSNQQDKSKSPPLKDPLNLLGGLISAKGSDIGPGTKKSPRDGKKKENNHGELSTETSLDNNQEREGEKNEENTVKMPETKSLDRSSQGKSLKERPDREGKDSAKLSTMTEKKNQDVDSTEQKQQEEIPKEMRTLLRALHAFPGLEPGDLPLTKGGLVWGLSRQGDWWQAGFTVESGFADALYRPRTMQTMFTFFLVSILVLYWHMDVRREAHVSLTPGERDALAQTADVRTGVFIVGLFLMMYFALQSRDGVMHRPHPIIWRCVHGAGVLYVMLLLFMLCFDAVTMRQGLHSIVSPSLGNASISTPKAHMADCRLSWSNLTSQFFDIFTLAHAMGYVAKALVYRDWYLLWMHSVLFEVIEISAAHLLPNFQECYWDRLFLDVFGANLIGMVIGMYLVNKLEQHTTHVEWSAQVPLSRMTSRMSKARRILMQFTPLSWNPDKWEMTENPEHFLAALTVLVFGLAIETTTFFLKHFLWIDTRNRWLSLIMLLKAALSAHAYREFYVFVQDRSVRLGHNCWLFIVLTLSEVTLSVKWSLEHGFRAPYPPQLVTAAWITTLCLAVPCFFYKCWFRSGKLETWMCVCMVLPLVMLLAHDVMGTAAQPPRVMPGREDW